MSDRRTVSSTLSSRIIEYLRDRGQTQAQIARMLGVSEGFVSLVKSKDRSLTIDHLELLSTALSVPMGALLLAVTEPKPGAKVDRKLFELSEKVIKSADFARQTIMRGPSNPKRRASA
jgi:transcriptional regulator with XRE-family HTH domain